MSELVARPYNKDYEITDAMFGAFRSPGGARLFWRLLFWTSVLFTVLYAVLIPPLGRSIAAMINEISSVDVASDEEIGRAMARTFGSVGTQLFILSLGSLAIIAVVKAAFYRAYFRNDLGGVFPFRLGMDEVRQFVVQLGYYVVLMVVYILILLVGTTVSVLLGGSGGAMTALGGVLMLLTYVGIIVWFVWFGVKFAPASALTALRGKTHLLAARHVSKYRFWALFGSLVVAYILGYIAAYFLLLVGGIVGLSGLFSGGVLDMFSSGDAEGAMATMSATTSTIGFKIAALIGIFIFCAGTAFYTLMLLGPSAFFVQQWEDMDPTKAFE